MAILCRLHSDEKDGTAWVIETKGGESHGKNKNIDRYIENKFNAFKQYAAEHNHHWGFVRDKDGKLYIILFLQKIWLEMNERLCLMYSDVFRTRQ